MNNDKSTGKKDIEKALEHYRIAQAVRDWAFANTDYPSLYSYCKYTNEASYKTAESIGMHFEKEYEDEANKITHVSVISRLDTAPRISCFKNHYDKSHSLII